MKKILIWGGVIIIVGVLAFYFLSAAQKDADGTRPTDGVTAPENSISGTLLDVTKGKSVRGIATTDTTAGTAQASFDGSTYLLNAEFTNLPDPEGDDFYEGWVVRKGLNFAFISTGALTKEGAGAYSNNFTASTNYLDYDFYVLTLEPDDGDPAPADHILEGDLR